MFEKEAKKWVKENMDCCKTDNSVNQSIPYFDEEERCCAKSAFQDGAEFGYNKANEWHYVKDKLPPKSEEFKICSEDLLFITKHRERYLGYFNSRNEFEAYNQPYGRFRVDDVYAWKEIKFPKLKESE